MFHYLILLSTLCIASGSPSIGPQNTYSAATPAQIRFAIENKYDATGPGAKGQEFAYNTYNNIEDALVGYLDDPDTKLPDNERVTALQKLYSSSYGIYKPDFNKYNYKDNYAINLQSIRLQTEKPSSLIWRDSQVKSSPWSDFSRHPVQGPAEFRTSSKFTVHEQAPSPSEYRPAPPPPAHAPVVYGFYTFTDIDGKQRTLHYGTEHAAAR